MLPCLKHWRILELRQCLGVLSGGILLCFDLWRPLELHQCWGILVLSAIHSCRIFKCGSSLFWHMVVVTLVVVALPWIVDFFRSSGARVIRIIEWGSYSSGSTDRRSNTLLSAPPWGSSVGGFIVFIGQHIPVLMMLMNLVNFWWVYEYGDRR